MDEYPDLPNLKWNRAQEIAPIICSRSNASSFKNYGFYGTDRAIEWHCQAWAMADGHKKGFFQNKREFIVDTILGTQSFYVRHSTSLLLVASLPDDSPSQWLGTGACSVYDANQWIQSMAQSDPMMLLIQIDISPIYQILKPHLQFAK